MKVFKGKIFLARYQKAKAQDEKGKTKRNVSVDMSRLGKKFL